MTPALHARTRLLLLVEPALLFRRIIVLTARDMRLADIHEAISIRSAAELVAKTRFDGLIMDLDEGAPAMELIAKLRKGESKCDSSIPIAALSGRCDADLVAQIRELGVPRLLLKPFKIKGVLETVATLWDGARSAPTKPSS